MDADMYNQPTEPWQQVSQAQIEAQIQSPVSQQQTVPTAHSPFPATVGSPKRPRMSRRAAIGVTVGAVAAAAGGIALEQWVQHGGLTTLLHGPMANNVQVGHLLRRAGFGGTPEELAMYRGLGFNGAVDRLLSYQQVPDNDMEQRLKALNLNLNNPRDQQRWWLLRMAWTQRPLLEKMTLFWHGVLTSSFRKVGGRLGFMRMIMQNQFLRNHAFDTI